MPVLSRFPNMPKYVDPVVRPLATWMPPLALLHHQGRKSGNAFETPVQAYRTDRGFVVGLAYTPDANWALNMLADDGGQMTRAGHRYTLSNPRRRGPEARDDLTKPIAVLMRQLDIDNFIEFDADQLA